LTGAFEKLLIYVGSGLMLISAFTIASVYLVRRTAPPDPARHFSVPGYPFTPAIFILIVIFSWTQSLQEQPIPTGAALITIVSGLAIYHAGRALGWVADSPTIKPEPQSSEGNL
jgi:APA family basic amino acid/polyamine antiporter